jgi:hypothetical protein
VGCKDGRIVGKCPCEGLMRYGEIVSVECVEEGAE